MPETGWFKQKTLFSLHSAGWEGQGQVAGWSGAWGRLASWFLSCLCDLTRWEGVRGLSGDILWEHWSHSRELHPHELITLQRPCLLNTITLQSWDFKVHILGRHKLSVCSLLPISEDPQALTRCLCINTPYINLQGLTKLRNNCFSQKMHEKTVNALIYYLLHSLAIC